MAKSKNYTPKTVPVNTPWKMDPWMARSEEFYQMVYGTGSCRFCGYQIPTRLSLCDCEKMKAARERFKRMISSPHTTTDPVQADYNPDEFTEQALP